MYLKSSLPQIQDRTIEGTEVKQWQTARWVSEWFSPVLWGRKAVLVKVLQLSGCSWCTHAQGDPSPAMEPDGARGSSHHIPPGHRRGSDAWTAWQWTHAGSRGKTGCPGREPSMQVGLRLSPGLRGTRNLISMIHFDKYIYCFFLPTESVPCGKYDTTAGIQLA